MKTVMIWWWCGIGDWTHYKCIMHDMMMICSYWLRLRSVSRIYLHGLLGVMMMMWIVRGVFDNDKELYSFFYDTPSQIYTHTPFIIFLSSKSTSSSLIRFATYLSPLTVLLSDFYFENRIVKKKIGSFPG